MSEEYLKEEQNTSNFEQQSRETVVQNQEIYEQQEAQKEPKLKKYYKYGIPLLSLICIACLVFGVAQIINTKDNKVIESQIKENTNETTVLNTDGIIKQTTTDKTANLVDVSEIVEEIMPSIVAITNTSTIKYQGFFGKTTSYDSKSCGSGILISQDDKYLYIVTNAHVVSDSKDIAIQFYDDTLVCGEIQGTDTTDDLAIVKVKLSDLEEETLKNIKIATISDCTNLKVGNSTIAIGNALGYGQTVTTGIISALDRSLTTLDETTQKTVIIDNLIQTDAAINPGNSGGALLNANGEVIGINSVKFASTEIEGIGYAISMKIATPIIQKLITDGSFERTQTAYLGVVGRDVDPTFAQLYNMPTGAYVISVYENSGAEQAGVYVGDIITKIDNKKVTSMSDVQHYLLNKSAGDSVTLTVERQSGSGYKEKEIEVVLSSEEVLPTDNENAQEFKENEYNPEFSDDYFQYFFGN